MFGEYHIPSIFLKIIQMTQRMNITNDLK